MGSGKPRTTGSRSMVETQPSAPVESSEGEAAGSIKLEKARRSAEEQRASFNRRCPAIAVIATARSPALKMTPNTPAKLTLYRGFPVRACFGWSPFVNKLEARLRLGGVKYELGQGNPRAAPRGKIPYIAVDGRSELFGDSTLITRDFIEEGYLADLNASLTPVQRAQDLAIRALLEDKLYFYQVREKWEDHYYTMRDGVLGTIPYPARLLVGLLAFRASMSALHGQGTLRYTKEEVAALRLEVWEAVNALLAESRSKAATRSNTPFWALGTKDPTEADPVIFGFITATLVCPASTESQKDVRRFPVVMEYAKRIHVQYFSDYELWDDGFIPPSPASAAFHLLFNPIMPQSAGLTPPGLASFLRSLSTESVDHSVDSFAALLRRQQIRGSKACALATASLLRRVVSHTRTSDSAKLLTRVREVGRVLIAAAPKELAIGNIVRRVLGLIRDESGDSRDPRSLAGSATPPVNGTPSTQASTRPVTSMYSILSHPTMPASHPSSPLSSGTQTPNQAASSDLRAEILAGIGEIIDELDQSDEQIANYALELISPQEVVLTHGASPVVQRFLLKAAAKRKFTVIQAEAYPNQHRRTHAQVTGNSELSADGDDEASSSAAGLGIDAFQKPLIALGINLILVPDSAIFALMSRVSKVVLAAHSVLSNGAFVATAGAAPIAKAAHYHRIPVLVLAATYTLSPQYPFQKGEALVEYADAEKVVPVQDGALRKGATVVNLLREVVPPTDVDLFVSNLGGVASDGVARLVRDQYWDEDLVL
ncbi:hypothetical protein DV735_g2585, partial [Chaetothyriales sp. CBS 134920]